MFSASDGRLLRWLVRSTSLPVPIAVSPSGTWVYYHYRAAPPPRCPDGSVEPRLWRVDVNGGPPRRADIRTTNLAFSPDGRMVAYTSTRRCGQTLLIVVRDQRTGATRRIVAAHNVLTGNGPVFNAQLSWAPDDMHLAVAEAPAAAINTLTVINALRATDITQSRSIPPCAAPRVGPQIGCLDPAFDTHGRLTFLKWQETPSQTAAWAVRWQHRHSSRLFQLRGNAVFSASISVDLTGNAILLAEFLKQQEIWRWSGGVLTLVCRSAHGLGGSSPLWLSG